MEFDITATLGDIDFGATGAKEILQNIRTILSTVKGSVPLDRSFGLSVTMLDAPLPAAKTKLAAEIIMAVHKYEPRFRVTKVFWGEDASGAMDGIIKPTVRGRIVSGI